MMPVLLIGKFGGTRALLVVQQLSCELLPRAPQSSTLLVDPVTAGHAHELVQQYDVVRYYQELLTYLTRLGGCSLSQYPVEGMRGMSNGIEYVLRSMELSRDKWPNHCDCCKEALVWMGRVVSLWCLAQAARDSYMRRRRSTQRGGGEGGGGGGRAGAIASALETGVLR